MDQEVNLVVEAFKFMFLGMGIVFSFLIVLALILSVQHKILSKFFKNESLDVSDNNKYNTNGVSNKKVAAIVTAIEQFNNKR